jgi:hypothetical protein
MSRRRVIKFTILQKNGFYGWITLITASIVMFFMNFNLFSFGISLPTIYRDLGSSSGEVSTALSAMMAFSAGGAGKGLCKKNLIDIVGEGGGLIVDSGSILDEAKYENVTAMVEFTKEYGVY